MLQTSVLEKQREAKSLSQKELANKAGMSLSGYTSMLKHKNPEIKTIEKLAEVLEIDPIHLLTEKGKDANCIELPVITDTTSDIELIQSLRKYRNMILLASEGIIAATDKLHHHID